MEKEIPETAVSNIKIIEWRPSMNYFKEEYVKLLSHVVEFLKQTDAGKRTTAAFGKRWFRNFFKNLKLINKVLLYRESDLPVIITGSGPGLEAAMPIIKKMQNKCLILAASSSTLALSHNGIKADITIATDGGSWALRHIYPFFRNADKTDTNGAFAVNLSAALPSQCKDTPLLIINDGSFWQSIILSDISLPSVIVTQKGTVTASAVELSLALSRSNIYLAGMDLGVKDIRSHVRPYGFDSLLFNNASRFTPFYSQSFFRSSLIQGGGSMNIYAAWFKNQLASWQNRVFSLGNSHDNCHEIFENSLPSAATAKNTDKYFKIENVKDDPALFNKKGASALITALKDKKYAENIKAELAPMLFPDEKEVTESQLETAIKEAACV